MATDRVICPQCGAVNIESPLITICSSCLGSLKGAQPAPEPTPPPVQEAVAPPEPQDAVEEPIAEAPPEAPSVLDAEPAPVAEPEAPEPPPPPEPTAAEGPPPPGPADFQPSRSPETDIAAQAPPEAEPSPPAPEPPAEEPPAPPERESFQPARSPDIEPPVSGPLYAELPSTPGPADFRPRRSDVPPLEVPTIPSDAPVAEPTGGPEAEADGPAFRPLKIICPNCRAANPPNFLRCNLCNTPLPTAAADAGGGPDWAQQWPTQPDRIRGSTEGQTKWGAACGCLVMGFIFFVLVVLSALR